MDWLVVILVVIALAMIGIVSLLHRGRVRLWSIAMILLGLGISIFLYTQIHIFQNWQSILYIVCSIALLLVLVYLGIVLRMRRLSAKDKQPEENDVLATASREPMRVSDWEAVIAYSAAPAKQKGLRRVAGKKTEVSASVPLASAAFTPAESPEHEQDEQKEMAVDAITSFFRENTKLPQSSVKSVSPFGNEKAAERKSFPEPLRVKSSFAKPAADPVPVDDDSEFESLSFRVVRDKSAKAAVAAPAADPIPEPAAPALKTSVSAITRPVADAMAAHAAQAPKTAVTKEARASLEADAPLHKVHKAALSGSDEQAVPAPEGIAETGDALVSGSTADLLSDAPFTETVQPANDVSAPYEEELPPALEEELLVESGIKEISLSSDEEPSTKAAKETFCVSEDTPRSSLEEAPFLPVLERESTSIDGMLKPSATQSFHVVEDAAPFAFVQEDAVYAHLQPAVEIAAYEPAVMPMAEPAITVEGIALEEIKAVEPETEVTAVMDIAEAEDNFEESALYEAPATREVAAEVGEVSDEDLLHETAKAEDVIAETENVPEAACLPREEAWVSKAVEAPGIGESAALSEVSAPENDPKPVQEEPLPVPAEAPPHSAFAQGMAELNALVASRAYRSAQTLIFDLLRMTYTPTEEEKKKLLLIMKLLKEKETRTDADARTR